MQESVTCIGSSQARKEARECKVQGGGSEKQAAECMSNGRRESSVGKGARRVMYEWKESIICMGSGQGGRERDGGRSEHAMCTGGGHGGREGGSGVSESVLVQGRRVPDAWDVGQGSREDEAHTGNKRKAQ